MLDLGARTSPRAATRPTLRRDRARAFGPGLIHCSSDRRPPPRGVHARGRAGRAAQAVLDGAREAIARVDLTPTAASTRAWASSTSRRSSTSTTSDKGAACAEALVLADELGQLGVPVYLYGELARRPHARRAAQARRPRRTRRPTSARQAPPDGRRDARRRAAAADRVQRRDRRAARDRQARSRSTCASELDVRALGLQLTRRRPGLHEHRGPHARDRGARWSRRSASTRTVTGAELVAPAPRAALANFPQDVPLRGPKPLEDHLPS